jgi:hypothetical protein
MTETSTGGHVATNRAGWFTFSGTLVVLAGLFNVVLGVVALVKSSYYVVGPDGLLLLDLTAWGWIHLVVGILATATGIALCFGATWARIIAVLLAGFNALAQLAFLSAYPLWGTLVIALDVLVIWAVIVHSEEPASE